MSEEKIIISFVGTDGSSTIEVEGVVGKSCKDLTAPLEKVLGKVTDYKKKQSFYQTESAAARQKIGGGGSS